MKHGILGVIIHTVFAIGIFSGCSGQVEYYEDEMVLPISRTTTYAPDSEVKSDDLNDIQDYLAEAYVALDTGMARLEIDDGTFATDEYFSFTNLALGAPPRTNVTPFLQTGGVYTGDYIGIGFGGNGEPGWWLFTINLALVTENANEIAEIELVRHTSGDPSAAVSTVIAKFISNPSDGTFRRATVTGTHLEQIAVGSTQLNFSLRVSTDVSASNELTIANVSSMYRSFSLAQLSREK